MATAYDHNSCIVPSAAVRVVSPAVRGSEGAEGFVLLR
jgi:hypothetical protein